MDEVLERRKQGVGFFAGPAAAALVYLAPLPLPPSAHVLSAILTCVVLYWITEPIPLPVTSLLGASACVMAGLGTAEKTAAGF